MLENNNNSDINLNLKIPPEQPDGGFSMKDLVLTLYNARKIFLTWCCIGLLLGVIAAGWYYVTQKKQPIPELQGDVSVTLRLNYYGAEWNLSPNGAAFDIIRSFSDVELWENALKAGNFGDITAGDVINQVNITKKEEAANVYILSISPNTNIFENNEAKKEFLQSLCKEYKNFIIDKYYSKDSVGMLSGQYLKTVDAYIRNIILWEPDPFNFETNFSTINSHYTHLAETLIYLYSLEPTYKSAEGLNFDDYTEQIYNIRDKNIGSWIEKLQYGVYIRNIDRFKKESQHRINTLERDREYYLELVASYNELLTSFQQKDSQGAIIQEAVNTLTNARAYAEKAADYQNQINQMKYNLEMLETDEQLIQANSREAEAAFTACVKDLKSNQEKIRKVIYDYYESINGRTAESSVLYSNASIIPAEDQPTAVTGVSTTRVLMLFVGLAFMGFAVGFCAAFIKKYLPEKEKVI